MRKKHLEIERRFYDEVYSNPATRLERGYGWDVKPSPSMVELFEKHVRSFRKRFPDDYQESWALDIGIGADGRNAQFFLQQGYRVMGVDISNNAIEYCINNWANKYTGHLILDQLDMSKYGATKQTGGRFNIIIDWSVMDHIRREYLSVYKANILEALSPGGYLFSSQFANPMPDKFKPYTGKDYYLWNGHYMRCFTLERLIAEFPTLKVIDYREHCEEDRVNGIKIHTVLFQKSEL
jgi:2-polyprenyl-3-methyl-5-hydroxy-6-metoxy-1,4-benzoquinol methylase